MRALIVISHPSPSSLTHAVAASITAGLSEANASHIAEIADLAQEGFDPRFTRNDIAVHLKREQPTADVKAEQARIDRSDALVLVYPVYWWSFPALLKGWIDRVFANGWAYDEDESGLVKRLRHLPVHLVAIGGANLRTYARHGYFGAMRTQIDHGIFDYCGARVVRSELLLPPADGDWTTLLRSAQKMGRSLFEPECKAAEAA